MLKQITKNGVESRLTDQSLFIFRTINSDDCEPYVLRFEVYPISKFGTPEMIMKALESENNFLFEEDGGDEHRKSVSGLSVL